MNGKRARIIRSITSDRTEYRAGKRYYINLGTSRAQAPAEIKERRRQPMSVASKAQDFHPLRHAFEICRRNGMSHKRIRNALPVGYAHGVRHESLDRLFGRLPGPVIRATLANLEAM